MCPIHFKSIFQNKKVALKLYPRGASRSATALSASCNGEIRKTTLLSYLVGLFVWASPWWQATCIACGTALVYCMVAHLRHISYLHLKLTCVCMWGSSFKKKKFRFGSRRNERDSLRPSINYVRNFTYYRSGPPPPFFFLLVGGGGGGMLMEMY